MSAILMAVLTMTMLATAFLSGIFGMAGGIILMGVLLAVLSVPEAMMLHAVAQITSNSWRGILWFKYVRIRPALYFLAGGAAAFAAMIMLQFTLSKPFAFIALGLVPFAIYVIPENLRPNPERFSHGLVYGSLSMIMTLLSGVSGPVVDTYFLGGKFDRREIIATKAVCQIVSHIAKFLFFGLMIGAGVSLEPVMAALCVLATILGTTLARPILDRLSDEAFRAWAGRIVLAVGTVCLARGGYALALG